MTQGTPTIVVTQNGGATSVSVSNKELSDFIYRNYGWGLQRDVTHQDAITTHSGGWLNTPQKQSDAGLRDRHQSACAETRRQSRPEGHGQQPERGPFRSVGRAVWGEVLPRERPVLGRHRRGAIPLADRTGCGGGRRGRRNSRRQETIVGTGALLSNGMVGNVAFAGEEGNRLTLGGNQLDLAHENYLLIHNGSSLTAVGASRMQHWTERRRRRPWPKFPKSSRCPRGQLARFERTLLEPTDIMVIHLEYLLKGTGK